MSKKRRAGHPSRLRRAKESKAEFELNKQQHEGLLHEAKRIFERRAIIAKAYEDKTLDPNVSIKPEEIKDEKLREALIEEFRSDPEEVKQILFVAHNRAIVQNGLKMPVPAPRPQPGSAAAKAAHAAAIAKAKEKEANPSAEAK